MMIKIDITNDGFQDQVADNVVLGVTAQSHEVSNDDTAFLGAHYQAESDMVTNDAEHSTIHTHGHYNANIDIPGDPSHLGGLQHPGLSPGNMAAHEQEPAWTGGHQYQHDYPQQPQPYTENNNIHPFDNPSHHITPDQHEMLQNADHHFIADQHGISNHDSFPGQTNYDSFQDQVNHNSFLEQATHDNFPEHHDTALVHGNLPDYHIF